MHGVHDVQSAHAPMGEFFFLQSVRDNAQHFSSARQNHIREESHQTSAPAAINQSQLACGQNSAQLICCRSELFVHAWI